MRRIVVGVDGSPASWEALEWALDDAAGRDVEVEVVHAFDDTPAYVAYEYPAYLADEMVRTDREHARQQADRLVADIARRAGRLQPGVTVRPVAVGDRRPARALLERARNADLLVVGTRGRGGFRGLLLGSVSQQCVHHATCPVVIVPVTATDEHG